MADYQEVVQAIRGQLRAGTNLSHDELADLASTYANLCHEANVRLRRCAEYLRLGCVSEATQLAGCQPVLERLVSALQFPELRAWNELCARSSLTPAPPILDDDLGALRSAEATEIKLRPWLARHRLLAIARAPTQDRLHVARALVQNDPENACWVEECKRLEPLRWSELRAKFRTGMPAIGTAEYQQLKEELGQTWHLPFPKDLAGLTASVQNAPGREQIAAQVDEIKSVMLDEDLLLNPPDRIQASIATWQEIKPYTPQVVASVDIDRIDAAIAAWQNAEKKKQEMQQSAAVLPAFLESGAVPFDPERHFARRTWLYALLVTLAIVGVCVAIYLNPSAYEAIKKVLGK